MAGRNVRVLTAAYGRHEAVLTRPKATFARTAARLRIQAACSRRQMACGSISSGHEADRRYPASIVTSRAGNRGDAEMAETAAYPYATHLDIKFDPLTLIDVSSLAKTVTDQWYNQTLC